MQVLMGKEYTTRDGRAVRIYAVDGGGQFPVHGAIKDGCGDWVTHVWSANGVFSLVSYIADADLIEAPRKFRLERWVNVWRDGEGKAYPGSMCNSREAVEHIAASEVNRLTQRIACIRIVIEGTEGDGLAESKEG